MVTIVFQKGVAACVHQVVGGSTRTLTLEMEKWVNWRAMWEVDWTGLGDYLDVWDRERERGIQNDLQTLLGSREQYSLLRHTEWRAVRLSGFYLGHSSLRFQVTEYASIWKSGDRWEVEISLWALAAADLKSSRGNGWVCSESVLGMKRPKTRPLDQLCR